MHERIFDIACFGLPREYFPYTSCANCCQMCCYDIFVSNMLYFLIQVSNVILTCSLWYCLHVASPICQTLHLFFCYGSREEHDATHCLIFVRHKKLWMALCVAVLGAILLLMVAIPLGLWSERPQESCSDLIDAKEFAPYIFDPNKRGIIINIIITIIDL